MESRRCSTSSSGFSQERPIFTPQVFLDEFGFSTAVFSVTFDGEILGSNPAYCLFFVRNLDKFVVYIQTDEGMRHIIVLESRI